MSMSPYRTIEVTPIAGALDRSAAAFAGVKGDHNMVVLVTDGAEECQGDPCASARRLSAEGLDVQINVVGFNLGPREREAVDCVTREGHGHYYDARDQVELVAALTEVRREIQLTQATPSAPASPPAPSAPRAPSKLNLFAEANGGQLVLAPSEGWTFVIRGAEDHYGGYGLRRETRIGLWFQG